MLQKMKIYLLIALFPCIWADDYQNIQCPDGNICPFGKTCCETPNLSFQCCDLEEEERYNKKLVPAVTPVVSDNTTILQTCDNGTSCSDSFCCDYQSALCCSPNSCCPHAYQCCNNATQTWCCKTNQRCADTYMYCIAGATALSPGFAVMILIFIVTVTSKRFQQFQN